MSKEVIKEILSQISEHGLVALIATLFIAVHLYSTWGVIEENRATREFINEAFIELQTRNIDYLKRNEEMLNEIEKLVARIGRFN